MPLYLPIDAVAIAAFPVGANDGLGWCFGFHVFLLLPPTALAVAAAAACRIGTPPTGDAPLQLGVLQEPDERPADACRRPRPPHLRAAGTPRPRSRGKGGTSPISSALFR